MKVCCPWSYNLGMTAPKKLTLPEVAQRLGVSRQCVLKWVKQGRIKARKEGCVYLVAQRDCVRPAKLKPWGIVWG